MSVVCVFVCGMRVQLFYGEPETVVILKTDDRKVIDNIHQYKYFGLPPEDSKAAKPAEPAAESKVNELAQRQSESESRSQSKLRCCSKVRLVYIYFFVAGWYCFVIGIYLLCRCAGWDPLLAPPCSSESVAAEPSEQNTELGW